MQDASGKNAVMQDFSRRAEERMEELGLTVFICGPCAKPEEGVPPKASAVLRQYISDRLRKKGFTIIWGEHRLFRAAGGNPWVRDFNDAHKEILFADLEADYVIIIADSPGSFAELGGFGVHKHIASKLLVIFDKNYWGRGGFLTQALAKAAKTHHAAIWFRNYQKRSQILKAVRRKLKIAQETKLIARSYAQV